MSHRMDHLLSGTRAQIAIKLFGPDLVTLRNKAEEIRKAMETVPASSTSWSSRKSACLNCRSISIDKPRRRLVFVPRPGGNGRHRVQRRSGVAGSGRSAHLRCSCSIQRCLAAIGGVDCVDADRYAGRRQSADQPGCVGPGGSGAEHDQSRECAAAHHRPVQCCGARSRVGHRRNAPEDRARCAVPEGYFVQYGGQFEAQEEAARKITVMSVVSIAGIFLLLYLALRSARLALLVMANLPLALIGGVIMVFVSGGTLSIASLVGFITLFGIATRNGIMLMTHYRHLRRGRGVLSPVYHSRFMERLSPILMTALVTGVG